MILLPSQQIKLITAMEQPIIILQGITVDELLDRIEERLIAREAKKVSPLSKTQACEQLGITYKTLIKIMEGMKLEKIFPSDIDRILLKHPKYIKKAKKG